MVPPHPPNRRKVRRKTTYAINMIFHKLYRNPLWQLLKQFSKFISSGVCYVTIIGGMVDKKSIIFEVFWKYRSKFLIFLHVIVLARSYRILVINIKSLIIDGLATLETSLKVPILVVFWQFWAFSSFFVLVQAFILSHWFVYVNSSMYVLLREVRDFSWHQVVSQYSKQCRPDFCVICPLAWPF